MAGRGRPFAAMRAFAPALVLACALAGGARAADAQPAGPWPGPLTDSAGDAERGLALIRDSSRASCLICHGISRLPDRDQGQLGPKLDGVAGPTSEGQLRQRIMDARRLSPDTIMPPYFSNEGLFRIGARWQGRTIYSAQEVEDVLAFLLTLGN